MAIVEVIYRISVRAEERITPCMISGDKPIARPLQRGQWLITVVQNGSFPSHDAGGCRTDDGDEFLLPL